MNGVQGRASKHGSARWRAVLLVAILATGGAAVALAQDAIATRQALMKANGVALRSIDKIIRAGGNAVDVVAPANRLAANAAQITGLFPPGSDQGKSEATPDVWLNPSDFHAKAESLQYQAGLLASAGQSGDLATVRAQFDKVVSACADCHKTYRSKK